MAEKAQAEPTMEEILASIRKIIADDGEASQAATQSSMNTAPKVAVNVSEEDDFDDLSLDDVVDQAGAGFEAAAESDEMDPFAGAESGDDLLNDVSEDMFEELTAHRDETLPPGVNESDVEDFDFGAVDLDADEPVIANEPAEETFDVADEEWETAEPVLEAIQPSRPVVETPAPEEPPMLRGKTESAAGFAPSGLTDERIAGAAASALGKLMVKKSEEAGDPNTLEGLMMELLRPMIKEWLDANLPAIVERKVEEEVQRIARMAR